jgi:hypothetical protein
MSIPGSVNPLFLGAAGQATGGGEYQIERSVRFNAPDSAYLSRTPASSGNRKTWTLSFWVKFTGKSAESGQNNIFGTAGSGTATTSHRLFIDSDALLFESASAIVRLLTSQVFRDYSAWYHIVLLFDTTQGTAADRQIFYVNGVRAATSTNTAPSLNTDYGINNTSLHNLGRIDFATPRYSNIYLADIHFIDGQALTPSSFVTTDATTGQLIPKAYTGSYGTNGFKLDFSDNSTAAALGTDTSSNGNTWTVNNISVTAGAGNDSLVDTPTNGSQEDTGVGGEVVGNYCTLNPLKTTFSGDSSLPSQSNGNLDVTGGGGTSNTVGTIGVSSGKFYYETTLTATHDPNACIFGLGQSATAYSNNFGLRPSGSFGGTITSGSAFAFAIGDTVGIAYEPGVSATFYKNNNASSFVASLSSGIWFPWSQLGGTTVSAVYNFGQRPFVNQSVPSGFKALCTTNLPEPTIADGSTAMDVVTWSGDNASPRAISGLNLSPDFVWIKSRSDAAGHALFDAVRGTGNVLRSMDTSAEVANPAFGYVSGFNSDGFALTAGTYPGYESGDTNMTGRTYVAWTWDAGGEPTTDNVAGAGNVPTAGSAKINGANMTTALAGSIPATRLSANASAGFSVVTFTGPASAGFGSVGHGLNAKPKFIICKDRSNARNWGVYHESVITTDNKVLILNSTSAVFNSGTPTWDVSEINSTIFTPYFRDDFGASYNANNVAYCFTPVEGYSAFGSYTGNGSTDGPMIATMFRPRWILIKNSSATADWSLFDTARDSYNQALTLLAPNLSAADNVLGSGLDILSNGFKLRRDASPAINASSNTFVYAAFAESPFQYSRAR